MCLFMNDKVININDYSSKKKSIKSKLLNDEIELSKMYSEDFTREFNEKLKEERSKKKNESRKTDC